MVGSVPGEFLQLLWDHALLRDLCRGIWDGSCSIDALPSTATLESMRENANAVVGLWGGFSLKDRLVLSESRGEVLRLSQVVEMK